MDTQETPTITLSPRERVLEAAEACFMARGYAAVTLRDIAAAVGIKHTSLYHHVPGGKEELFVEVVERSLERHRQGLRDAVERSPNELRPRLHAVADWFLTQSPMDLVRMTQSDIPALSEEASGHLEQLTHQSILRPIEYMLRDAHEAGEIRNTEFGLVAGGIVGMLQSLFSVPEFAVQGSRAAMGKKLVDVFIDGVGARD
ncbi:MAG: TetR/AcrR family transcriptional regulator [Spirochaetota bacterium]